MAHYIDADLLRAEIDKRYAEYRAKMKTDDFTYYEGMADALDHFEQYIDSLPEQPSLPSVLDEAAEKYANREYPNEPSCGQWGTGDYEPPVDMEYPREIAKDSFKAGAEWHADHAKIDVTDFCKPIDPGIAQCIADHSWEMLGEDEKHVPNDLDEAAEKYAKGEGLENALGGWEDMSDAFKAGAEWMAGQGWISVDEKLPKMDEEVIVLTDELGTAPIYKISFGHIVNIERCIDYNGWNIPGVKYWMPCPEIPNE